MLVIHPYDPTTDFLRVLYEGREGCRILRGDESRNRLADILYHLEDREPVMLLGHGSEAGLFRREGNDYRRYVGRSMAACLRRRPVIGIWCHANLFAEECRIHGLFSGMVVSEREEALDYGIPTDPEELARENLLFASTLAGLLKPGFPFREIPSRMREAVGDGPAVRAFNYNSLYAL